MKVLDPGHKYELGVLDGGEPETLTFVKREGPGFPGNVGHHPGTTGQEVTRALVQRFEYVNNQIPCEETQQAIECYKKAIWFLEVRAAKRHKRDFNFSIDEAVYGTTCKFCGHFGCGETCERSMERNLLG